jgi:DMSO/TMAO reductase YedYZ molybdopterin-dependent catalytic subunit
MKRQYAALKMVSAITLMFALILSLIGCQTSPTKNGTSGTSKIDVVSKATESRFRAGEIQEFQGKFLSPAVGPRDNSIAGVQKVDISKYSLQINGLVNQPIQMSYDEVKALPAYERLITLHCVEGWDATLLWKGVLIEDLLNKAGVRTEAVTVIFHGVDNYTTSIPLATVRERKMILAYMSNGLPLPPEMGYPFIVVAEDKLGYKWARWVTRIELSSDKNYAGYWEQAGYSNSADVPDSRKP